jgi:hypothetical protein
VAVIPRQELYDRRCVAGLIHIVEQTPLRAEVRHPLWIRRSSAGLLLLWSLLRWERNFVIQALEGLGLDLWRLTRDVDETLKLCSRQTREAGIVTRSDVLDPLLRAWLDLAAAQAGGLHHDFLSGEHLLLALLADRDSELAAVFQRNGLTYDSLRREVIAGLSKAGLPQVLEVVSDPSDPETPVAVAALALDADQPSSPKATSWIADLDRPAVGVPRRFGVFLMMLMVTLYAVLFSILRVLRATNLVFGLLAALFTGIGIGQAVLFQGRFPRAASIWIGAILVPIEAVVYVVAEGLVPFAALKGTTVAVILLTAFVLGIPAGAVFGYLFGTVTAGGFYLVDWYEKRQAQK